MPSLLRRPALLILLPLIAGAALLLPSVFITHFLYDDHTVILLNAKLQSVHDWSSALFFRLQPSRPVSNLFLAFGQWWGKGNGAFQRALTLGLHLGCIALVYLHSLRFLRSVGWALAVAVLFAIHPLHAEQIAVISFRWEILGTFFLLTSLWLVQKKVSWALFFSIGLSALSKETYVVFSLVTTWLLAPAHWRRLVLFHAFWAAVIFRLTLLPTDWPYLIGHLDFPADRRLELVGRGLVEGMANLGVALDLCYTRLWERGGVGAGWPAWTYVAVIVGYATALLALLRSRRSALRLAGFLMFGIPLFYASFPDVNLGAQHYFYPVIFGFALLLAEGLRPIPNRAIALGLGIYVALLGMNTVLRSAELQTRESYLIAEIEKHPEAQTAWDSLISLLVMQRRGDLLAIYLPQAQANFPDRFYTEYAQFHAQALSGAYVSARATFEKLVKKNLPRPVFAFVAYEMATLEGKEGKCADSKDHLAMAQYLEPLNTTYQRSLCD